MSDNRVTVDRDGAIATVTLNRPEKRNGLDLAMFEAIIAVGQALVDDKALRAVVLTGRGKGFCAGLDWASFMADPSGSRKLLDRPEGEAANLAQKVGWVWQEVPVPVISAVHGFAIGGGLQIAVAADLVFTTSDAVFAVAESDYGLIPDMSISQTLLKRVRMDLVKELIFTGRRFSGEEAVSLGAATRCYDDPLAAAHTAARQIASRSPHMTRAAKRLVNESAAMGPVEGLALETALQLPLLGSANQMEAALARMQQREPSFADVD
jgi:enoyl-CoA hydratase/carnithine racemase